MATKFFLLVSCREGSRMSKGTRLKFFRVGYQRVPIPGANILANVAAKYVLAHGLTKVFWNCSAQLDGQV